MGARRAWVALCGAGCLSELPELDDPCGPWPDPGLYRVTVEQAGEGNRRPHVYVPAGDGPREIVVLLHGGGMTGPTMEEITGFEDLADRDGFVLVYPNGLGWPVRVWNAGQDRPGEDQDDLAFLDRLSTVVSDRVCGGRVLATGFSNGAMMAQRWACQGKVPPDAVTGASGQLLLDRCPGEPLPIRYYHGTEDPIVPFGGGVARGVSFPSVDQAFSVWRERNRCVGDGDPVRRGDTTCTAWACEAPTVLCTIEGWRHQWPGGIHSAATSADATGEIWTWFRGLDPAGAE